MNDADVHRPPTSSCCRPHAYNFFLSAGEKDGVTGEHQTAHLSCAHDEQDLGLNRQVTECMLPLYHAFACKRIAPHSVLALNTKLWSYFSVPFR